MTAARASLTPATHALGRLALVALTAWLGLLPLSAQAWWDSAWAQRTRVVLNTSAAGVTTREAVNEAWVPVRLHSGNFDFLKARPDGADLRVLAADDKTALKFALERFDVGNELAILRVLVPTVAPGSDRNALYVYAGNPKAEPVPAAAPADPALRLLVDFNGNGGAVRDLAAPAQPPVGLTAEPQGLVGPGFRASGTAVEFPARDALRLAPGAAATYGLWARPAGNGGTLLAQGALRIGLDGGKVAVRLGRLQLTGGELPVGAWAQVVLTLGAGKATLYVQGVQAAQADLGAGTAIEGAVRLAEGFSGALDEIRIDHALRGPDWVALHRAAYAADAKLVASTRQSPSDTEAGAEPGYMGILVKNLTLDAWVVIVILAVMFVVACWVMVVKWRLIARIDRGNRGFMEGFRAAHDVLVVKGVAAHPDSPLARLYDAGLGQLRQRRTGEAGVQLSGASLDAVKAAVDADLVRESHKLNSLMVLLTIAISGGPFLGLLGTVVGVMITFAAIAAAGDVNVNAIAPGIAAALLATVAGLAVAIPALFGYNYLASRLKALGADMQIFVDEFVTRVAEQYGQR